jgi:hypothetical protein
LTVAFLGGQDAAGQFVLFSVQVLPESPSSVKATAKGGQVTCPPDDFCVVGRSEIVIEFANAKSKRAQREKATWKSSGGYVPGSLEYAMFRTIRMVELTIKYRKGNEVGGPIDAVQLRRDNGNARMRWFARKPNCPQN